jgi:hypothetical protein
VAARRFALLTDNHIRQPIVDALRRAGWDVVRAVDLFGESNEDEEIFRYAAEHERVFLTNDQRIHTIAHDWLAQGRRSFRMVYWWAEHRRLMSNGDVVRALEQLAANPASFGYSIEYLKPQR